MAIHFRSDGWVKSAVGPAVPGAQVWVVLQPANTAFLPPTPLADIFSDPNGLVPIVQPIITDGFGHYDFYVLPGFYTVVVGLGGRVQQVYADQSIGISGSSSTSIELQVNGAPNIDQSLLNLKNSATVNFLDNGDGSVSAAAAGSGSGVDIQVNGASTPVQDTLNFKNSASLTFSQDGAGGIQGTVTQSSVGAFSTIWATPDWAHPTANWSDWPTQYLSPIGVNIGTGSIRTVIPATPTESTYLLGQESMGVGSMVGWSCQANVNIFLYLISKMQWHLNLFGFTDLRYWVGLTDNLDLNTGILESNTPPGNLVGFRYSNDADSSWTAVCQTSAVSQTTVNTGVPVNTTGTKQIMEIRTAPGVPGTVLFFIDGTQVASISTNVPTATTGLQAFCQCESLAPTVAPSLGASLLYFEIT